METLLGIENISYSSEHKIILSEISFEVRRGEKLGISGESGSGKTTLAKLIAGIYSPSEGSVSIKDETSASVRAKVLMLFQNNGELIHPFRKTGDLISEALRIRGIKDKKQLETETASIIALLDIKADILKRRGCELSGGEQQRIGLARLLALKPEILIVDEPFSSQDPESTENIINILNKAVEQTGLTLICISHDIKSLCRVSDEMMILYKGRIAEKNPTAILMKSPEHPYTKFILNANEYNLELKDFAALQF